jgi:hypothetical protein
VILPKEIIISGDVGIERHRYNWPLPGTNMFHGAILGNLGAPTRRAHLRRHVRNAQARLMDAIKNGRGISGPAREYMEALEEHRSFLVSTAFVVMIQDHHAGQSL